MIGAVCCAFAYAIELSERTFSATAALIGAATFALMSDIAARSGSSSPASSFSSSRVRLLYSCGVSDTSRSSLWVDLLDAAALLRVRVGDRVVARHVQRGGEVHRRGDVRVDERHRSALRQRLAGEVVELLAREAPVLLGLVGHLSS